MLTRIWLWLLTKLGRDPRGLFVFYDGWRWRSVDPLEIARAFFAHPTFDWDETPELLLTDQAPVQLEAFRVIGVAVREVFQIKAVTAGGLSDRECLDLFLAFRQYLGNVKKNGSLFPISRASTALPESSADMVFPTKPASASGSTPPEPSPEPSGSPAEPTAAV